jgi:predicted dehydrogenase
MRIALVGCGRWGRYILRDLVSLGCDVTVVARTESSRERAVAGGADAIVADVTALDGVDGIVVATPVTTHAAVVARVLPYDVPVFVEKPLTDDPVAARDLAERAAGRLFVMDKWRYHPGIEAMAAMARSNEYGKVRAIHNRRLSWGHDHDDVDATWILLPHDLAIVREIAGWLPEATAAVGHAWPAQQASLTGLLGPHPACTVEVSTMSPIRERRVLVEFEHAVALWDDGADAEVRIRRRDSDEELRVSLPSDMPLLRELTAFVDHLRGGPPPRSSAAEGAETVERIAQLREMAGL